MQRRKFISSAALTAIAVSSAGFVRFNGHQYEGDCETTTDILGPFYRPDAPVRTNLRIPNAPGQQVLLSGYIKHKDCTTPLKNACVELWHCDANGVYDNDTADFKYRGKTYCDDKGYYHFETVLPVPYGVGNGNTRPAHYHMMISAPGYQNLITQLYFNGDKHITKDRAASSPAAKRRILEIKDNGRNEKSVSFDITMLEKLPADPVVVKQLAGTYIQTGNPSKKEELYEKDNLLWIKDVTSINGGYALQYTGNNSFALYGRADSYFRFEPLTDGTVKLTMRGGGALEWVGMKAEGSRQ